MVSTQRLVRREFLRFGKRSGEQEEETLGMESEPNFEGLPEGKVHFLFCILSQKLHIRFCQKGEFR